MKRTSTHVVRILNEQHQSLGEVPAWTVRFGVTIRALVGTTWLLAMLAFPTQGFSQIVAGEIPEGYTLTNYTLHLEALTNNVDDEAGFDVDCDGVTDFLLSLSRNMPELDLPNRLYLQTLSTDIQVCAVGGNVFCPLQMAGLFADGQAMACGTPSAFSAESSIVVGDYFTQTCQGVAPSHADSAYVLYEKTVNGETHAGWIKLSFNIESPGVIAPWAELHSAIGFCIPTSVNIPGKQAHAFTFSHDGNGMLSWSSKIALDGLVLHDALGRVMQKSGGGHDGYMNVTGLHGMFFLVPKSAGIRAGSSELIAEKVVLP